MPQSPDWKRVLETGIQFTELRRSQAHRLASDLVAQGQLARDQVGAAVDELIEISRHRSEELRKVVSTEVQRQLGALGLATQNDLAALERRLRGAANAPDSKRGAATTKKSPKTAPAKKAPAKKAPAKKAPAKKAAKKSQAQKSVAKAARTAPAKKAR
jgi:polyhydroxyalkanoate synthesis regulator phasin